MSDYDNWLYDNSPYPDTHPDWVTTQARLFGMSPRPVDRSRVLELGCGLGGNLIPMAATMPRSEFVGIDASAQQIARGQADVEALGLGNIRLEIMDIRDVPESFGLFDTIICHGVYSWVDDEVQQAILRICRDHLRPDGVAYVSYNTLPGWHMRGTLRDILLFHVGRHGAPGERVAKARELLEFLGDFLPVDRTSAAQFLKSEVDLVGKLSDAYLLYEHLVGHNQPIYFYEFAERAARTGLRYVGDAEFAAMTPDRYGPDAASAVARFATGQIQTEQYLDFLSTRFFRRSIVCHKEVPLRRDVTWKSLRGMRIRTRLEPADEAADSSAAKIARFNAPDGYVVSTADPLLEASLVVLHERSPAGVPFEALASAARARLEGVEEEAPTDSDLEELGDSLLEILAQGYLNLGVWERPFTRTVGDAPVAFPLARLQAGRGDLACTNLLHELVVTDKVDRVLLAHMDGIRDVAALAECVRVAAESGRLTITVDGEPRTDEAIVLDIVDIKLKQLARSAFLQA